MNKYFIVKRGCGFAGDIYKAFVREQEWTVEQYMQKHPNCELVLATPWQDEYLGEVERLKKEGINVY